jgi:hypothetical protein
VVVVRAVAVGPHAAFQVVGTSDSASHT